MNEVFELMERTRRDILVYGSPDISSHGKPLLAYI